MQKIAEALCEMGCDVVVTREPGGSALGSRAREWLLSPDCTESLSDKAELFLFLAARAQHIQELIKPALDQGKVVLCDRFNDSTVVYQGLARGLGVEQVENLCDYVTEGVIPNLTLLLDIDPEKGLVRTRRTNKEHAKPGQVDRIEAEKFEFHQHVRNGFHLLANKHPHRIKIIDASQSKEEVYRQALRLVTPLLS